VIPVHNDGRGDLEDGGGCFTPLPAGAGELLLGHLEALLPMRNPPGDPRRNAVLRYAHAALAAAGRVPLWCDDLGSLYAPPLEPPPTGRLPRAVVAHTDSVLQEGGADEEPFMLSVGVYRSARRLRPLGGDDKCGVAVALTLAALLPEVAVVLPADEEVGLDGAAAMDLPVHELMVECDRRGGRELVFAMLGRDESPVGVASQEATFAALELVPHREPLAGGGTDVAELVTRGLARNAFNLSVGYYDPHTPGEYVVAAEVARALHDAAVLLCLLPDGLPPAPGVIRPG